MPSFEPYSLEHYAPIAAFMIIAWVTIRLGRSGGDLRRRQIGLGLALITLLPMIAGSLYKLFEGSYTLNEDLPLYLCRIVAWTLPLVIWRKSKYWLTIFYFWVFAGTLQGLLTPDLAEGFPNLFYFRYWCLHCGLIVTLLYAMIVFRIRPGWRDFWHAIVMTQVYVIIVHLLNVILGSNYSYTMRKPPGASILDFFGPWPWYLLVAEVMMFVFFLLLLLPFILTRRGTVN